MLGGFRSDAIPPSPPSLPLVCKLSAPGVRISRSDRFRGACKHLQPFNPSLGLRVLEFKST